MRQSHSEIAIARTPAFGFGLRETRRQSCRLDITIVRVTELCRLADDEFVEVDACLRNLEDGGLWPCSAGGIEQVVTRGILGGSLCRNTLDASSLGDCKTQHARL